MEIEEFQDIDEEKKIGPYKKFRYDCLG